MKYLIIIIMTALLVMVGTFSFTYADDKGRAQPGQDMSPAPEFVPESEPALDWEGELNPNEFDNWKVLGIQPTPQGLFWMFVKNPDENSPIDVVAMVVDGAFALFGYRYFKYGEPYSFTFDPAQLKYVRKPLTQKQKDGCKKCHDPDKIPSERAI